MKTFVFILFSFASICFGKAVDLDGNILESLDVDGSAQKELGTKFGAPGIGQERADDLTEQFEAYKTAKEAGRFDIAARLAVRTWVRAKMVQLWASKLKGDAVTFDENKVVTKIDRKKIETVVFKYSEAIALAKIAQKIKAETDFYTDESKREGAIIQAECEGVIAWLRSLYEDKKTFNAEGLNVNVKP